jgi:outer membrane autotransporter protein
MIAAPVRVAVPKTAWWAQGIGAWGKNDGDSNAAGLSRDLAGFFTGVDHRFGNNWRAGIAGGYTNSSVTDSSRASSANIDTAQLGAYAGANYGAWNLRVGAAGSWSTIDTNRQILFPGFSDDASARYGAMTAQLFSEVGYSVVLGTVAAEPFAGLAWVHLSTDSFNETAGTMAALAGASSQDDVGYSTLGARAATIFMLPNGMALTARASAAWQHAFGDVTPDAVLAFEGTASAFTVAGVPLARDAALLETGFDVSITPRASVGISYTGQLAQGLQDNSVKGNLLIRF